MTKARADPGHGSFTQALMLPREDEETSADQPVDLPPSPDPPSATVAHSSSSVKQSGKLSIVSVNKIAWFAASLICFILALQLMKEGARGLSPFVQDRLRVETAMDCLGFGWLLAYLVLSGSPVAAIALTFFDVGVIDKVGAFTMITGSRLGASFVVLFVGFIYSLRGHERRTSLSTGLLSLAITWSIYLLGLAIGLQLLMHRTLDFVQPPPANTLQSALNMVLDPIVGPIVSMLPRWGVFLSGVMVVLTSFSLFDRALPQIQLRQTEFSQAPRLIYRPIAMFLLGAAVTSISMSVSVSVSILVPLSARGYIRRENVIPYIMGANVTTFVDTLFAALVLNNPLAFTVVFVEMLSVALVSLLILLFLFRPYERMLVQFVDWVLATNRRLAVFMLAMFVAPVLLLWIG